MALAGASAFDQAEAGVGAAAPATNAPGPSETVGLKGDEALAEAFAAVVAGAEQEAPAPENQIEVGVQAQRSHFVAGRLLVKFLPGGEKDGERLLRAAHVYVRSETPQIGLKVVELPPGASERAYQRAFRRWKEVEFAELDHVYQPAELVPNDPWYDDYYPYSWEWHLPQIGALTAWVTTTGSPDVIIAILDSGVYAEHPDLAAKIVPGWNCFDDNPDTSDMTGHGTGVAGQAGASSNNNMGVASPAWGCKIMPIRVTDIYGWAAGSTIVSGLAWAADHGARVANLSFGAAPGNSTIRAGAAYFQSAGGVVAFSTGNEGVYNPAPDDPEIIHVGATDQSDVCPTWSNWGNYVDLVAPGVSIITTSISGGYASGTGTSASAPIVAGVAALVLSVAPDLTGPQVQQILKDSADDLGDPGWDPHYGWGRVNAAQAVNTALSYTDTEPPTVSITSPANEATVAGTITVQVSASDNVAVTAVDLYIDDTFFATDSSAPYSFSWNTTQASDGTHTLQATAHDAANNAGTCTIAVSVYNPAYTTTPASYR